MKHETLQLSEKEYVTLTTYVLDDSPEMLNGKSRPAILICPGGGYLNCSDREAEFIALRYNSMGYHSFVLRYSTYTKGNRDIDPLMSESLEPSPETAFPAALIDVGLAMKCIHEHAEQWLVDVGRIAICGFSAGAHNCAMYAANWDKPVVTASLEGQSYKPAAAILAYGIYDFQIMIEPSENPFETKMRKLMNVHFMGTDTPSEELLYSVSPARQVTDSYPPTFLWATSEDSLVPAQNSCEMALALAKSGVPFESHIYEKGHHGLSLANQAVAASKMDINPIVAAWISSVENWLLSRFALDLPERPLWMDMMEKNKA